MARLGLFGLQFGHIQRDLGLLDQRVQGLGLLYPEADVVGLHRVQQYRCAHWFGLRAALAHQLVQRQRLDAQVVVGGQFLGHGQVVAGLGVTGVHNGGGADLEVAFGRGQLFGHGGLQAAHIGQAVGGGQHIEEGLTDPHDQVLLGGQQLVLGQLGRFFSLGEACPVAGAIQGLGCSQGGRLQAVILAAQRGERTVLAGLADRCTQTHGGQYSGSRLFPMGQCGIGLRFGRLVAGVIALGCVEQFHQALGLGHPGTACSQGYQQGQQRKRSGLAYAVHGGFRWKEGR